MSEETVAEMVIRTWKASPKIQAEFQGNILTYEAFCRADDAGLIKIYGR